MGIGDFWLQSNNGTKISLQNLKELKKSDLKGNDKLIKLFDFFNTNKSNGSEEVLDKQELTSLFNAMQNAAQSLKGKDSSIFETEEAEEFISTTQTSEGKTLKGVKASDLFNFITSLVPKNETHTAQVQSGVDALENSYTPEEIEDLSIQTVTDDVRKARQIFNSQNENQGVVSDFVNGTKETFDTEFASSRVNRYLMREELCADLLAKSKSEEGLSEKEYLEAKINLAVSMLPKLENSSLKSSIIKNILSLGLYNGFGNKTRAEQERIAEEMEIELLKDALRKLKPEDLTLFIQRVTAMPDAEFTEKAGQVVENMINQSLQEKISENQKPMADTNQVFIKHQPIPGSIEYIEQHNDAYRKMTFEETFEAERGVQYNQENIMDYAEKDAKMQFLLGMHNKREQIYNILHDATVTVDGNNKLGAPDTRAIKPCEEQLESAIIQALRNLYGDDIEKIQEGLNKLGISNLKIIQNGNNNDLLHPMKLVYDYESDNPNPLIKKMDLGGYDLVNIANKLQNYVDTNYQNALGGKTLEEYGQEVNSAYQMAYGARNAQHMAEAFAESQQEGVQTVKTVVQMGGMVVMVAGQLVPVGGQVAAAMTMGGLATSAIGGVGISALENFTKAGGATEEDKKEMLKELLEAVALVGSGGAIGKTSEAAFRALVINKCPKLLAFASEVGIDATMSLAADYAITGQIDLSGEGIAQLQSILVGILHAKGNFSSYLNTHAGNVTTKPNDSTSKPRIDDLPNVKEEGKSEVGKPKFGLEDDDVVKQENAKINKSEVVKNNIEITNDKILNIKTKEELVTILKDKISDPKLLEELNNLSDKDFSTIKRAVTHTCDDWMGVEDNINSIVEMLNTIKQHSIIKNRSLSDELNFIDKILSEPETPDSSLLIDCRVTYRIPNDLKSLDILETLLHLKATCDNPLLNIDNIVSFAYDFKDISDINILVKRLKAKNADGTYKYSVNDYGRYDVEPQLKTKDLDTKKQNLIDDYKDYPETQNKLKQLLQNADEDMIKLIESAETECRCKDFNNPQEKVAKLLLSRLNELDPNYLKSEINYLLENVEDKELKILINNAISNADNLTICQKIKKLQTIQNLLEMHNHLQGKSVSINSTYWKNYLDELAKDEPELAAKLRGKNANPAKTNEIQPEGKTSDIVNQNSMSEKALNKLKQFIQKIRQGYSKVLVALGLKLPNFDKYYATEAEVQQHIQEYYNYLKQELSESQKIEQFVEYCKTNKDEISDYLYNEVYLNSRNLTPEVKSKCSKISEQYGVKVFLESDINDIEATTLLKNIDEEFNKWQTASDSKAKMPPTLDLTITKSNYIDQESAYGQGVSAGFSEWGHGAISINGQRCFDLKTLRHEMTHTNDLKNLTNFNEPNFVVKDEQGNIIAQKCKYYDEFVKIGIPEYYIAYAYNNPKEFIAVASEGNLSLCSPKFKQVLIDFGMPEWRFNFDN